MYDDIMYEDLETKLDNYGVLKEVYIGKTPDLLKAEQAMYELHKFMMDREKGTVKGKIMKQKAYHDLVTHISNEFNIKNFKLIFSDGLIGGIDGSDEFKYKSLDFQGSLNFKGATSIPVIDMIKNDIKNISLKTGKTDKISGKKSVCIMMNSSIILSKGLSPEEMMAILLHELGHSFELNLIATSITTVGFLAYPYTLIPHSIKNILSSKLFASSVNFMNMKMPEFISKLIRKGHALIDIFLGTPNFKIYIAIKKFFETTSDFFKVIYDPKERSEFFAKFLSSAILDYSSERYADSFATTYGYGEALSSALRKLTYLGKRTEEFSSYSRDTYGYIICDTLAETFMSFTSPHPTTISRIKNQIKKLNRDLDKIDDPMIKKEIKKQIDQIQEIYDNYYKIGNRPQDIDRYNGILKKIFTGDDWRSSLFEPYFKSQEL